MTALQDTFHVTLPSATGPREVEIKIRSIRRLSDLLHDDGGERDANLLALWLRNFLVQFANRVDARRLRYDRVGELATDVPFSRALIAHVRALLDEQRERGKIFALCPGCEAWEAEMTVTGYALTIAHPIPSTFDGPFLAVPWVGTRALRGLGGRARFPRAARIRFVVPSGRLEGTLGPIEHQDEEFQPRAPVQYPDDDEDEDAFDEEAEDDETRIPPDRWGPGWVALLRLSRAINADSPEAPRVTIEQLEALPATDFFFLDLLHFLIAKAPIRPDTPGVLTCPDCKATFLPVRPDPGDP